MGAQMRKILVDGSEIDVPETYTLLQACEAAGREIPRFCFHERLSIAGNCRMCLVEVKGGPPKPAASCAMNVRDLRPGPDNAPPEIFTNTPMVRKAREGVMEFLLINHPLDCPICDQGGECDLQDQAMAYGFDTSRYSEHKRAVENKYIGPLVKTIMTRCIHCTRCVRFTTEVCGVADLGLLGRGEDAEISSFLEAALSSEMQGNVVDLCPVGALTHRPLAFSARPWELRKTESIDVMDAMGAAIRIDTRGREVMRITPRLNEEINQEWLGDKSRYVCDGLKAQRLDRPYTRENDRLCPAGWDKALGKAVDCLRTVKPYEIAAIAGDLASVEEMFALKLLMEQIGSPHLDCRQDGAALEPRLGRQSCLFNAGIAGIDRADAILLIGANPRLDAPVLNARIRQRWLAGDVPIAAIGSPVDLTYPVDWLGKTPLILEQLCAPDHPFHTVLQDASHPLIIVGQGALQRADGLAVASLAARLARQAGALGEEWNGYCVLHTAAARVGGLDIGFVPGPDGHGTRRILDEARSGAIKTVILLGADEIDTDALHGARTIYIGSHGDAGAHCADIVLAGAAWCEKAGYWVNLEGRVQAGEQAALPPGEAREDWKIVRALSARLGAPLPFDTLDALRAQLGAAFPQFAHVDAGPDAFPEGPGDPAGLDALAGIGGRVTADPFAYAIADYYLTNPIARASKTMAECSALARARASGAPPAAPAPSPGPAAIDGAGRHG